MTGASLLSTLRDVRAVLSTLPSAITSSFTSHRIPTIIILISLLDLNLLVASSFRSLPNARPPPNLNCSTFRYTRRSQLSSLEFLEQELKMNPLLHLFSAFLLQCESIGSATNVSYLSDGSLANFLSASMPASEPASSRLSITLDPYEFRSSIVYSKSFLSSASMPGPSGFITHSISHRTQTNTGLRYPLGNLHSHLLRCLLHLPVDL